MWSNKGPRAVDALFIPLLDEEVAYEVLRRLAETRGNFQEAAEMADFESRKPKIARQIMGKKNSIFSKFLFITYCASQNSRSFFWCHTRQYSSSLSTNFHLLYLRCTYFCVSCCSKTIIMFEMILATSKKNRLRNT